jgi:hypothetical protein
MAAKPGSSHPAGNCLIACQASTRRRLHVLLSTRPRDSSSLLNLAAEKRDGQLSCFHSAQITELPATITHGLLELTAAVMQERRRSGSRECAEQQCSRHSPTVAPAARALSRLPLEAGAGLSNSPPVCRTACTGHLSSIAQLPGQPCLS